MNYYLKTQHFTLCLLQIKNWELQVKDFALIKGFFKRANQNLFGLKKENLKKHRCIPALIKSISGSCFSNLLLLLIIFKFFYSIRGFWRQNSHRYNLLTTSKKMFQNNWMMESLIFWTPTIKYLKVYRMFFLNTLKISLIPYDG